MTRLPFERRDLVRPAEGPDYLVIPSPCSNPFCDQTGTEKHHLVRRSELAGAYDWVEYQGVKIGNVCALCHECHRRITENEDWITWSPLGSYMWNEANYSVEGKLDPHPPIGDVDAPDVSGVVPPAEVCPTCLRPHARRSRRQEGKRERKAWTISVPVDHRENGADVLDELLEASRELLAKAGIVYGDEKKARYFILSATLALFVQHGKEVLGDA